MRKSFSAYRLWLLIHSLSAVEKTGVTRAFAHSVTDGILPALYKILEGMREYDTETLEIAYAALGKTTHLSKSLFKLRTFIYRHLPALYVERNGELSRIVQQCTISFDKGDFDKAVEGVDQARQLCIVMEDWGRLHTILSIERELLVHHKTLHDKNVRLKRNNDEWGALIVAQENYLKFVKLEDSFNDTYYSEFHRTGIKPTLKLGREYKLLELEKNALSKRAKVKFHKLNAKIKSVDRKLSDAVEHLELLIDLCKSNPWLAGEYALDYHAEVQKLALLYAYRRNFSKARTCLRTLEEVRASSRNEAAILSGNVLLVKFSLLSESDEVDYASTIRQFESCYSDLQVFYEATLLANLLYIAIRAAWRKRDSRQGYKYIDRLLTESHREASHRLHIDGLIYLAMFNVLDRDFRGLASLAMKGIRYLEAVEWKGKFEMLLFKALRGFNKETTEEEVVARFLRLRERVKTELPPLDASEDERFDQLLAWINKATGEKTR